ncbi:hypothetical protein [Shewanella baltica]|uniref:hypothetical protein n=1 Tax=Shewanella baltica TaxID=62322 RepID=UPI001ED8F011|nr:hypothetical protein [Shewanella baltica]
MKPSSISRIMQAADMPEKFVNSQTTALLTQDVTAALNAIGAQHQDKGLIHNAVDFAIQHISEKEAGYSQKELIVNAIKYAFEEKAPALPNMKSSTPCNTWPRTAQIKARPHS